MIDVEPISEALLARVAEVSPVVFATRQKMAVEQLPDNPACIVSCQGASVSVEAHGRASRWAISYDVTFLARWDGSEVTVESRLNEWLYALQEAMQPDPGEMVLTLGGLCEHAWISGDVDYVDPSPGQPWAICVVGVEVTAVG